MLNIVALCGRIAEIYRGSDGAYYMTLAVENDFIETDGTVKEERVTCALWRGIADSIREYYRPGQCIQVAGRLVSRDGKTIVMGEKIAFQQRYAAARKRPRKEQE